MTSEHGGDRVGFSARYGHDPLDFSANTNPMGMPPGAVRAAAAALFEAEAYPDPHCRALRGVLARREGVEDGHILCGNGAAELIFRLALALRPQRALVTSPAFSEYERALGTVGCKTEHYPLRAEDGFALRSDILEWVAPGLDVLFLCEPANPTGQTTPIKLLLEITQKCARTGTLLVVDECFGGFLDEPEAHTLVPETGCVKNLLILKAFTKIYAMAGLRLGYCICGDENLLAAMARAGQPWAVSNVAQAAGAAALADAEYLEKSRALIREERAWLAGRIRETGCRVYGSKANYIFFESAHTGLWGALAERGLLIRDCANYRGLAPGFYRVAVRKREDNEKLAAALAECLHNPSGATWV